MAKKILFFILLVTIAIFLVTQLNRQLCVAMIFKFNSVPIQQKPAPSVEYALELLKIRKDDQALSAAEKILADDPENLEALWIKAEYFRRKGFSSQAEDLLRKILNINPEHFSFSSGV